MTRVLAIFSVCWLENKVKIVTKPTNVITPGQPTHEKKRLKKIVWKTISNLRFLIFRGFGWP